MSADSFFVDTNVILYALDGRDLTKQVLARRWLDGLWGHAAGRTSWQVIHEFYANAVKFGVEPARARREVQDLLSWEPLPPTGRMLAAAWQWCDRARLNFWDAMILAAAEQSGSRWLLSEDFQTDRRFGSVTVVSPFEHRPEDFGLV